MSKEVKKRWEIESGAYLCHLFLFKIDGTDAKYEEFGQKFDRDAENAPDYCCNDMRFTGYNATSKEGKAAKKKYKLTTAEFKALCADLDKALSFGSCGWCE